MRTHVLLVGLKLHRKQYRCRKRRRIYIRNQSMRRMRRMNIQNSAQGIRKPYHRARSFKSRLSAPINQSLLDMSGYRASSSPTADEALYLMANSAY